MQGVTIAELVSARSMALARGDRGLAAELTSYLAQLGWSEQAVPEDPAIERAVPERARRPLKNLGDR